jgi:hypothetical protein
MRFLCGRELPHITIVEVGEVETPGLQTTSRTSQGVNKMTIRISATDYL